MIFSRSHNHFFLKFLIRGVCCKDHCTFNVFSWSSDLKWKENHSHSIQLERLHLCFVWGRAQPACKCFFNISLFSLYFTWQKDLLLVFVSESILLPNIKRWPFVTRRFIKSAIYSLEPDSSVSSPASHVCWRTSRNPMRK